MNRAAAKKPSASLVGRVLVVDDHANARESTSDVLRQAGHQVEECSSAIEAIQRLEHEHFDVVITDLMMPGMTGLQFIRHMEDQKWGAQVVMVTAHATVQSAVEAMRHGAFDYLEKPFDVDRVEQLVHQALQRGQLVGPRRRPDGSLDGEAPMMIGNSSPMRALRQRIQQVAGTIETVLISGESGTGKELVARTLHAESDRADGPLVSLNCPVLSAQLMESELFGHQRGAFTGADADRTGRFEMANGGTILLDEVTEVDNGVQAKLLRVLQEKNFERVGSSKTIDVDVRVLATTNRDLGEEVQQGRFRQDLYYRLAVVPLQVPALRQRSEDIPQLIDFFLLRAVQRLGKDPCTLTASATDLLTHYHWPGNVRELENIVTRACVLNAGNRVTADELRPWLIDQQHADRNSDNGEPESGRSVPVGLSLEEMERRMIEATLDHYEGHRAKTAKALGIGVRTLSGKLKSYGYAPRARSPLRSGVSP